MAHFVKKVKALPKRKKKLEWAALQGKFDAKLRANVGMQELARERKSARVAAGAGE